MAYARAEPRRRDTTDETVTMTALSKVAFQML
jgi:hypothetical protein